jgi:Protein of unknown function (DUF2934)
MKERLVEVKRGKKVLHTFPASISDPIAETKEMARAASVHSKEIPQEEVAGLEARMHVTRGGPLEPFYDSLDGLAETSTGPDQLVRERAYFLWEQAGRPDGKSEAFWNQAQHQHWSERAYALWEREGCPAGKADEHWLQTCTERN